MFERVPVLADTLLEQGVLETLCNVTRAVQAAPARRTDLGGDERVVLLDDLRHFYALVAEKAFW